MRIALALLMLVPMGLLLLAGCQAPCDRMCDAKADYIQACVDFTNNQLENERTPPLGWDVYGSEVGDADQWWDAYGVAGADDYASTCKESGDGELSDLGGDDQKVIEQECEDEAIQYEEALNDEERPTCYYFP